MKNKTKKVPKCKPLKQPAVKRSAVRKCYWVGIVGVTDKPLVSSDFIGSPFSCVVDLSLTKVVDGDLVKILAWYDNEWGYSLRLMDLVMHVGRR